MNATWPSLEKIHTIAFDFDGVFTDNRVYVDQNGIETVRCDRGDGLGMGMLKRFRERGGMKADCFILSKETNPVVMARATKLGVDCRQGVQDKVVWLREYFRERHPGIAAPFDGLIYLGNDLNDLPVMRAGGFSVAPVDSHPLILRHASVVLPQRGGEGFVRAFVEKLVGIEEMTPEDIYSVFVR